jgi:hypothetical protein
MMSDEQKLLKACREAIDTLADMHDGDEHCAFNRPDKKHDGCMACIVQEMLGEAIAEATGGEG